MAVWAIADLHLSFGVVNKEMDIFGSEWVAHAKKIETYWKNEISEDDLVLIPGDISWGKNLDEALPDLKWIDALPGTKVIIRGNHDYWWTSLKKLNAIIPSSIHVIHNNTFDWKDLTIGGTRLWDSEEYSFNDLIEWKKNTSVNLSATPNDLEASRKVFQRELNRLELSLKNLNQQKSIRIAMTHYPPIGADLQNSKASSILEKHNINICVFGHLHSLKKQGSLFGHHNNISYVLSSCDYLNFSPIKILD